MINAINFIQHLLHRHLMSPLQIHSSTLCSILSVSCAKQKSQLMCNNEYSIPCLQSIYNLPKVCLWVCLWTTLPWQVWLHAIRRQSAASSSWKTGWLQVPMMLLPWIHASQNHFGSCHWWIQKVQIMNTETVMPIISGQQTRLCILQWQLGFVHRVVDHSVTERS